MWEWVSEYTAMNIYAEGIGLCATKIQVNKWLKLQQYKNYNDLDLETKKESIKNEYGD